MEPEIGDLEAAIEELVSDFENLENAVSGYFSNIEVKKQLGNDTTWKISHDGYESRRAALDFYYDWKQGLEPLIRRYLPDDEIERFERSDEHFRDYMSLEKRKGRPYESLQRVRDLIHIQRNLLESIPRRIKSERLASPRRQSKQLLGDELEEAKRLLNDDLNRPAGVLAGVALERHLIVMAESTSKEVDFEHSDDIKSLGHSLKDAEVIDETDRKQLVYLSGIRNKCAHADEEDPTHEEVRRLVNQVDNFIGRYS